MGRDPGCAYPLAFSSVCICVHLWFYFLRVLCVSVVKSLSRFRVLSYFRVEASR